MKKDLQFWLTLLLKIVEVADKVLGEITLIKDYH